MVSLKVNIHKKDLWLLSAIVVFLVGVGFVVAYNANYPGAVSGSRASIMGHTADEIDGNLSGGGGGFENYGSVATISTIVPTTETNEFAVVQATTDLLLVATCAQSTDGWTVVSFRGYTGTTSNPTTYRAGMAITDDWGPPYTGSGSFTMFVKKGEYYVVKGRAHMDAGTTRTYTTIPITANGGSGESSVLNNCLWQDVTWNTNNFCPIGKVIQGINTCPRDGHRDVCKLYCCDII